MKGRKDKEAGFYLSMNSTSIDPAGTRSGEWCLDRELAADGSRTAREALGWSLLPVFLGLFAYSEWMNAARSRSIDMLETDAAMAFPSTSFQTFGGRSGPLA